MLRIRKRCSRFKRRHYWSHHHRQRNHIRLLYRRITRGRTRLRQQLLYTNNRHRHWHIRRRRTRRRQLVQHHLQRQARLRLCHQQPQLLDRTLLHTRQRIGNQPRNLQLRGKLLQHVGTLHSKRHDLRLILQREILHQRPHRCHNSMARPLHRLIRHRHNQRHHLHRQVTHNTFFQYCTI